METKNFKHKYRYTNTAALCAVYTHCEPEFHSYRGLTCITDFFDNIKEISVDFSTNKVNAFPDPKLTGVSNMFTERA